GPTSAPELPGALLEPGRLAPSGLGGIPSRFGARTYDPPGSRDQHRGRVLAERGRQRLDPAALSADPGKQEDGLGHQLAEPREPVWRRRTHDRADIGEPGGPDAPATELADDLR